MASLPERRLRDTVESLQRVVKNFPRVTARELARVVGKIISMSPVMDIFKVGRWSESVKIEDQRLQHLRKFLPTFCLKARADNTVNQYRKERQVYRVPCKMIYCNTICEISKLHLERFTS
ncbi:uncharacterized protein LOC111126182 [Crassostrea virginica]